MQKSEENSFISKVTFRMITYFGRGVGKKNTVEKKLRLSGLKTTKIMHE